MPTPSTAPRSLEQAGATVDEAVRAAVDRLGVSRDQVDVDVLREGRAGLFGMRGARSALVRVTVRAVH